MERIVKQPTAILVSDIHLREDTPICRTDISYWDAQWRKIDFISDLQKKYDCIVLCGGDLFDKAKPSLNLVREAMIHLPNKFYTTYGQHDLPSHSLSLSPKCGIDLLQEAKKLQVLGTISYVDDDNLVVDGIHWGQEPKDTTEAIELFKKSSPLMKKILVWHKMVWQGKKPYPDCVDEPASVILKKYKDFDLIVTGDNHKTFVEEYQGRILVNPGSLMRMDADQIDHKPSIFLWHAEDNTVEQVFLPIEEGVVSREHLIQKEERDGRITAFIEKLDGNYEIGVSFEENLENFFKANNTDVEIKNICYGAIESK